MRWRRSLLITALVALLLGVLGAAGATITMLVRRSEGHRMLEDVLKRHDAAGLGTDSEDIVARAPHVQTGVQDRCYEWFRGRPQAWVKPRVSYNDIHRWAMGFSGEPEGLGPELEDWRTAISAFEGLARSPDLRLSGMGWARQDLPRSGATPVQMLTARIPNLLFVRRLAEWYGRAALRAPDPEPALAMLDRIPEMLRPSFWLIDAMILVACEDIRDQEYLDFIALRGAEHPRVSRWLAEKADTETCILEALRCERILLATCGRDLLKGRFDYELFQSVALRNDEVYNFKGDETGQRIRSALIREFNGSRGCALILEQYAALEGAISKRLAMDWEGFYRNLGSSTTWPFSVLVPNFGAVAETMVRRRSNHRAMRCMGWLVSEVAKGGSLPASDAELRVRLGPLASSLDGDDLSVGLRYDRLDEHVASLTSDPRSPVPLGMSRGSLYVDEDQWKNVGAEKVFRQPLNGIGLAIDMSRVNRGTAPTGQR